MNEKIKTICLILITITVLIGAIFYCYVIYDKHLMNKEKQQAEINFKKEQLKIEKEEKEEAEKEAVKNKLLLDICLDNASASFTKTWNKACKEMGLKDECSIPIELAESIEKTFNNEKDECFKKYPQK